MLRYLDGILAIMPMPRGTLGAGRLPLSKPACVPGHLEDCEYLLKHAPPDVDLDRVRELRRILQKGKQ